MEVKEAAVKLTRMIPCHASVISATPHQAYVNENDREVANWAFGAAGCYTSCLLGQKRICHATANVIRNSSGEAVQVDIACNFDVQAALAVVMNS